MAPKALKCLKPIRAYMKLVKKSFPVKEVYLFGSHARGNAVPDSDIDIAIVSLAFKKIAPIDRLVALGKIAWKAKTPEIEAIGYTPDEFNNAPPWEFPVEIRKTGILIK